MKEQKELLLLTSDEDKQSAVKMALAEVGFSILTTTQPSQAERWLGQNPKKIIILDSESIKTSLILLEAYRSAYASSYFIVLTQDAPTEQIIQCFREGAKDVIVKKAGWQDALQQAVRKWTQPDSLPPNSPGLVDELSGLSEEFFHRLTKMARQLGEMRDQLRADRRTASIVAQEDCHVLVVEEDGFLTSALLTKPVDRYTLRSVVSGGMALDFVSNRPCHVAFVSEHLPDLSGHVVIKTLAKQCPDALLVLFRRPDATISGHAQLLEGSTWMPLLADYTDANVLARQVVDLCEVQRRRRRERRYLVAFREENYELLRKYRELKQKLKSIKESNPLA